MPPKKCYMAHDSTSQPGVDLTAARAGVTARLLAACEQGNHWTGRLSSSALSTATAAFALAQVDRRRHESLIRGGLDWLGGHCNSDGGWGDTPVSDSNISTTVLCWSALRACGGGGFGPIIAAAGRWLARRAGGTGGDELAAAVTASYGKDRTFSAPILAMCALAGSLGESRDAWRRVPALPFELGVLGHRLLRFLRLPVVSYALPALIAIGQVRHHFRTTRCPVLRPLRALAAGATLRRLAAIQPASGGYLEAAPLTAFVVMSLASMGLAEHPVVAGGVRFLAASAREDGSWPIDTNLCTWVTSLAAEALTGAAADEVSLAPYASSIDEANGTCTGAGARPEDIPKLRLRVAPTPHSICPGALSPAQRQQVGDWLLACRHDKVHPYTGAAAGGWAWTDLSGGVPDADDTAGALVALARLNAADPRVIAAARDGVGWLVGLQNADGGIPTFCRGWGRLPFDRSSPDLTAHALRAFLAWRNLAAAGVPRAIESALDYLRHSQRPDGAWTPLWFGNERAADHQNPTYGTARVVQALVELAAAGYEAAPVLAAGGVRWLLGAQNADGGWGGARGVPSTIEEAALAVRALAEAGGNGDVLQSVRRGCEYLAVALAGPVCGSFAANSATKDPYGQSPHTVPTAAVGPDAPVPTAPIGLYFAKLWYYEELYPLIFAAGALRAGMERLRA